MITGLLNNSGWHVTHQRPSRGLRANHCQAMVRTDLAARRAEPKVRVAKVPQKQPKKGRLGLNDGSCVRLRAERPNHVWSYDFIQDQTHDGRVFRILNIIDALPGRHLPANAVREFTKEALATKVKRRLNSTDMVDALTDLFILRGPPVFIRSPSCACTHALPGSG